MKRKVSEHPEHDIESFIMGGISDCLFFFKSNALLSEDNEEMYLL